MTEPKNEIAGFVKAWAPIVVYLATIIGLGVTLYADVGRHEQSIAQHSEAIKNMDKLIAQQKIQIKHNESEINRLRNGNDQ